MLKTTSGEQTRYRALTRPFSQSEAEYAEMGVACETRREGGREGGESPVLFVSSKLPPHQRLLQAQHMRECHTEMAYDDDDDAAARSMSVDCSITSSRSSDPGEEGGLLCILKQVVACIKLQNCLSVFQYSCKLLAA